MNLKNLQTAREWKGEYQKIQFEIRNWNMFSEAEMEKDSNRNLLGLINLNVWNYYIYINPDKMPIKEWKEPLRAEIAKGEWESNFLSNLPFHGGITYMKEIGCGYWKIGCDYNHSGDEGREYSAEQLLGHVKKTIETFWSTIVDLV